MSSRRNHTDSQHRASALRLLDRNSRLSTSSSRPERHPLASPDSPVKNVRRRWHNGRLSYAVAYQTTESDAPSRPTDDICRAVSRVSRDEARRHVTEQWLEGIEQHDGPVSHSGPARVADGSERPKSLRRAPPAALVISKPGSEGIAREGQQGMSSSPGHRFEASTAPGTPDLAAAWPVPPPVPSPPPTPRLSTLSTPELSPLTVDGGFCYCDGEEGCTEEARQPEHQSTVEAQVLAALEYMQRAQAGARDGRELR